MSSSLVRPDDIEKHFADRKGHTCKAKWPACLLNNRLRSGSGWSMDDETYNENEYHELVIDGTLDLHIFHPREVKELIPDYLQACREEGILTVRIVHGKGSGTLRRIVHSILDKHPDVVSYRLAGGTEGGWGATLVELKPIDGTERTKMSP